MRFRKVTRQVVRVRPGATASVMLEADAVDGYFDGARQPSWQFLPPMGTALRVYSKERLSGGRMRVRIKAAPAAALGLTQLTASYLPPNAGAPLTDTIDVEIVASRTRTRSATGQGRLVEIEVTVEEEVERPKPPPYEILFSDRSPSWAERGMEHWSEDVVGEYKNDVAYVNGSYAPVKRLLHDARHAQREQYLSLYAAPVIMTLIGLAKEERNPPRDEEDEPVPLHESYRQAALQGVALSTIFTIRKLRRLGLVGDEDEE
jgi:hypothetical protein